jgi:hypothetical protein
MPSSKEAVKQDFWIKIVSFLISFLILLVPFYAFLSVWTSSLVGHFTVVRLWDDVLLLIVFILSSYLLIRRKAFIKFLFQDWTNRLIFSYGLLTVLLGITAYFNNNVTAKALFYALLINLRYLVLFLAARFIAVNSNYSSAKLRKIIFYPLLVVGLFAILQFLVLPHNFLSHFGYGASSYPQYITINQNDPTIRVQSFLRGPNPLGAYLAATMCILGAYILRAKKKIYLPALFILSFAAIYLSFSRSALIGLLIGLAVVVFAYLKTTKLKLTFLSLVAIAALILSFGYLSAKNNTGVKDFLFHHSNHSTALVTSNEAHLTALKNNVKIVAHNPLGNGPGSSGQASWYNKNLIRNPEDYFIQIAEETGWLGIILFVSILGSVGYQLWLKRDEPLALGLFGGLIAISVISLFSYTWSDDTLAFMWWGLAGIALTGHQIKGRLHVS